MAFALASVDELRRAGSAAAAAGLARRRLANAEHGARTAFHRSVASRLAGFPEALERDIAAGGARVGIANPAGGWPLVVLANGRGRSCCMRFEDGHLAVVDAGFLADAALFVFFATRPRDYAPVAAAAIFALSVSAKGARFPSTPSSWTWPTSSMNGSCSALSLISRT